MRAYWTLVRRDLAGYFVSLTGYVIIASVLLLLGLSFVNLLTALNNDRYVTPITEVFYETMYFWLILLITAPVITMRLFALEKFSGTYETMMTAPVSDLQVVLAKFTSALVFFGVMWLPMLGCLFIVRHYAKEASVLEPGITASTFLGIYLIGALYMAIGCFASALTRSQVIAAIVSFAIGIALFLLSFLSLSLPIKNSWQARLFAHLSMIEHMRDFVRGIVDTRYLIFYLSLTGLFLFLTLKVVESRRWK